MKPPKKVAQPDDVALLLTLAKTLRINLEFKKSDPGMFINCFNLLNSLVAAAPSSTFKELNLKQGNFLIFELFQNLFKLIIKLDPHNDPFLTAALQPKIDATPRPS